MSISHFFLILKGTSSNNAHQLHSFPVITMNESQFIMKGIISTDEFHVHSTPVNTLEIKQGFHGLRQIWRNYRTLHCVYYTCDFLILFRQN